MEKNRERLKLQLPPLALALGAALLMWLPVRWLDADTTFSAFWSLLIMLLWVSGLALIAVAVLTLYLGGTTLDSRFPEKTDRLITQGVYGYSRNPVCLGLLLLLSGWGLYLDSFYALPGLLLFFGLVTWLQVLPEEGALRARFGDSYRDYCRRVRRWL